MYTTYNAKLLTNVAFIGCIFKFLYSSYYHRCLVNFFHLLLVLLMLLFEDNLEVSWFFDVGWQNCYAPAVVLMQLILKTLARVSRAPMAVGPCTQSPAFARRVWCVSPDGPMNAGNAVRQRPCRTPAAAVDQAGLRLLWTGAPGQQPGKSAVGGAVGLDPVEMFPVL